MASYWLLNYLRLIRKKVGVLINSAKHGKLNGDQFRRMHNIIKTTFYNDIMHTSINLTIYYMKRRSNNVV